MQVINFNDTNTGMLRVIHDDDGLLFRRYRFSAKENAGHLYLDGDKTTTITESGQDFILPCVIPPAYTVFKIENKGVETVRSLALVYTVINDIPTTVSFSGGNAQALKKFMRARAYDIEPNTAFGIHVMPELIEKGDYSYYECNYRLVELEANGDLTEKFLEATEGQYKPSEIDPLYRLLKNQQDETPALPQG